MAALFDGINDGLNLGATINWLNGKAAATLCAWVQRTAAGIPNQEFCFLSKNGGVNPRVEFECDVATGKGAAYATAPDGGAFQLGFSTAVIAVDAGTPGTWTHCAAVIDVPGDRIHWYLNGVLSLTTVVAFAAATFSAAALGAHNTVGYQNDGATKFDFFAGTLSDLRLYERALTADEIRCVARMRGHDGIRGNLAMKFNFAGQNTIAMSTANVKNASPLPQAISTFASLESAPIFGRDTIALRRRT